MPTEEKSRRDYRLADGTRPPSVTTIIGSRKDPGGLLYWAFEQGKAAERGEIKSLYDRRDQAAAAGTLAHDMIEASVLWKPGRRTPEDVLQAALPDAETAGMAQRAFQNFERWIETNHVQVVETEMLLVSEEYRYGGTPDAVATINGQRALLDWKTSNSVHPDYMIQLAAYEQLLIENRQWRFPGGFHLLRFSKDTADWTHHYWGELSDAWEAFKHLRAVYEIDRRLKKRCR